MARTTPQGFLKRIKAHPGCDDGDQYGGGAGQDGSGLPQGLPNQFRFATGIEGSNPTIDNGRIRRDLFAECGFYDRWREDFGLVHELGLRCLRYGPPIHRTVTGPDHYDWSFADETLAELQRLDIEPIVDLLHFGLPDSWGDFQNPDLPLLFQRYCAAFAERYPHVRCYTPVNEIYVTVRNSARDGLWNEQKKDDRSFVTALKHAVAADILGCHALAARRPDLIVVQSESAEYLHQAVTDPSDGTRLQNQLRFTALDLLYAHDVPGDLLLFLMDNGLTREEYAWFMRGEPPGYQVLGLDYYGRNEKILKPDGTFCDAEDVLGWRQIAHQYHQRYRKPLMHTETNTFDPDKAGSWLWKQWINVAQMRADGVPVLGFTWYSLTDQIDWDSQLAEQNGTVIQCGLYDLDRQQRPVGAEYRTLLEQFGRITLMPHAELLQVTDQPARLKVEV